MVTRDDCVSFLSSTEDFHPVNISAQNGSHAYLPCVVKRLGSKSVSWIRKRDGDGDLVTVDRDTFIGDGRFEALHVMASDTWTLHIRNIRPEDAGIYECQVSSEPKTSLLFQLSVICPQVEIKGAPDIYVNSGSQVEIVCLLSDVLEEPPFIFWHYGDERLVMDRRPHQRGAPSAQAWVAHQLTSPASPPSQQPNDSNHYIDDDYQYNYDSYETYLTSTTTSSIHSSGSSGADQAKRKIRKPSVRTWSIVRMEPGVIASRLTITNPSMSDSGHYQCRPSNLPTANVTLHVLDGEHEEPAAAVQDGTNSSASAASAHWRLTCLSNVLVMVTMTTASFLV